MTETTEKPLTLQEAFDQVWRAFVVEKRPKSIMLEDGMTCAYRGPDGAKCAVGVLLRDDEVDEEHNGTAVSSIRLPDRLLDISPFLGELQACHDGADYWRFATEVEIRLREFAKAHFLAIPGGAQ